jgi:hypothetical protein
MKREKSSNTVERVDCEERRYAAVRGVL